MNDIWVFDKRVNFIAKDTERILDTTKSSVILQDFDISIELLNYYLGEMAYLDRIMVQLIESRRQRRTITQREEDAIRDFAIKRSELVAHLKKSLDTVEKRRKVIAKISASMTKRSNSKTEKKSPKSSPKGSPKNSTRKVVISNDMASSTQKIEKDLNKERIELEKAQLRMEKEREQQEKLLAKEREKQEKLLAKEREKQEKLLAKDREKQEKLLAKEREKLEKEKEKLAKEQEKQAKSAAKSPPKEIERAIKKQAGPETNEQLLKDRVATFVFKKEEFRSLSNFWPCLVSIVDGEQVYQYSSGEHAFHGEKYRRLAKHSKDAARQTELHDYSKQFLRCNDGGMSALDAKRKGGKGGLRLSEPELKLWDKVSLDVQREISTWKVNTIPMVRQDLLNTGTRILVHSAMRTSEKDMVKKFWEGKAIVNEHGEIVVLGGNWLGKIWMEVRDKL
uniref:NADAR domain-containing protein n=1 Tax=viral metagenome TaxID=1070528 RepID=A0A6C0HHV6_9ZZZZ